jgi:prepilin-type N-terminal cleavage/methylation domain-containing protein
MKKRGFTLVELLVVISVIAMLLAILMPALSKAREMGMKTVCTSNTKQLQLAWSVYAQNNNGSLVYAATTRVKQSGDHALSWVTSAEHPEASWVGCPCESEGDNAVISSIFTKDPWYNDEIIKMGTLYSCIKNVQAYRCPAAIPWAENKSRSYAISSRMNGFNADGSADASIRSSIKFTKMSQITNTSSMMVFICQGGVFSSNYGYECYSPFATSASWRDLPPPIHIGKTGTSLSFTDGHSDYWKWQNSKEYVNCLTNSTSYSRTVNEQDFGRVYGAIWCKRRW